MTSLCRMVIAVFCIVGVLTFSIPVGGVTGYTDPNGVYTVYIPTGWVFQVQESCRNILVFHGNRDVALFYIESLGSTADPSPEAMATRVLAEFAARHGLPEFEMQAQLAEHPINNRSYYIGEYRFAGAYGFRVWEIRAFVFVEEQAYSLALGGRGEDTTELREVFFQIIRSLEWYTSTNN